MCDVTVRMCQRNRPVKPKLHRALMPCPQGLSIGTASPHLGTWCRRKQEEMRCPRKGKQVPGRRRSLHVAKIPGGWKT